MINLSKNKTINLTKETGGATEFEARAKWDIDGMTGEGADIDIIAIACDGNKKCLTPNENYFVYNMKKEPLVMLNGGITHSGDVTDGGKDGWDEIISFDFPKIESNVETIAILVNTYDPTGAMKFGNVSNLEIQIFEKVSGKAVASYYPDLENDEDNMMVVGEIARKGANTFFKAIGAGSAEGLPKGLVAYGIDAKY